MIYEMDEQITIRSLRPEDAQVIAREEVAQGWVNASPKKYEQRLRDQQEGKAIALAAEYCGQVAGYINVYLAPEQGVFAGQGIPEIVDFGVLAKYRNRGIGSRLMDAAERIAAEHADTVFLGVGLHSGYGSAQRMYIKRGYIPDGSGVWYRDAVCAPYAGCRNDDDLVLYLSKKLR